MNETGAKTGVAGLVMGLVLCSALQFLTPLFAGIPQVRSIFPPAICRISGGMRHKL